MIKKSHGIEKSHPSMTNTKKKIKYTYKHIFLNGRKL